MPLILPRGYGTPLLWAVTVPTAGKVRGHRCSSQGRGDDGQNQWGGWAASEAGWDLGGGDRVRERDQPGRGVSFCSFFRQQEWHSGIFKDLTVELTGVRGG